MSIFATHSRRELLWLALVTVLYYGAPALAVGPLAEIVAVPAVLAMVVVVPGIAVTRLLRARPRDPLETLAVWSAHGLVALMMGCFIWALSGISLDVFRYVLPVGALALWLAAPAGDPSRPDAVHPKPSRADRRALGVLSVALVLVGLAVAATGPPIDFSKDTLDHVGYINEVVRSGEAFPTTAVYADGGANGADLRKSLLHGAYGMVAAHAGLDGLRTLAVLNAFLLLMLVLAVYSAAQTLFGSRPVAIASAFLFLLSLEGGLWDPLIRAAFYPNRFGVGMLMLFTASAMAYLHSRSRMSLAMCAIYAFGAIAAHVQFAVLIAATCGVITIWKTCSPCRDWGTHLDRSVRISGAALVGLLPYGIYRYLTAYQTNDLHAQVQGAVYVAGDWFITDPIRTWGSMGWIGLAALFSVVALWHRRRDVPGIGFIAAALPTVLFIQFNPFIVTPLYDVLTYLVFRLERIVPFYMLTAFLLVKTFTDPGALVARARWRYAALVLALIGVVAGLVPLGGANAFSPSTLAAERRMSHHRWAQALHQLTERLPAGSIIASDPVTSYTISALTPHYVVCTLDQHAPPNDLLFESRMSAARSILSPFVTMDDRTLLVRDTFASHIVVNTALPPGMLLNYWTMDPDVALHLRDALVDAPDLFEGESLTSELSVFRWTGAIADDGGAVSAAPVKPFLPAGVTAVGTVSGEAVLVGARIGAGGTVRTGGRVDVDLYWSRARELPPGTYIVSIRFDHAGLDLPLGGKPFPKLTRKVVERMRGERYRFRRDHMPLSGIFTPDAWPRDAIVSDPVTLLIPSDIAAGRYRVQAKLLRVANKPNYHLRDFLFDDDIYAGVDIGDVEIVSP